ncbi:hypothetical protein BDZ97DRAFT_1912281 [Flammula alnicola]|nr:hypothetical protein BDZ97DRAFT_1912281 [Flammula alnicola]
MVHSPGPSASDIQTHLYNSFLQASTYDVALRVNGTWNAIYKLHRVVLIQSGFFRSLFTGGFSESAARLISLRNGTDEISVIFDDDNITRAAFEVCISRLYGGGPLLHVSPNLIPTTKHPLTPPFSGVPEVDELPARKHPATPRFLQSLLATSIYLSIPSVASQALSLILKTIGPTTVVQYLDFACGKPANHYLQADSEEPQAAVGLENVAHLLDEEEMLDADRQVAEPREGLKPESPHDANSKEDDLSVSPPMTNSPEPSDGEFDDSAQEGPSRHYGALSDKIGEACACWLTRWAVDMLHLEAQDHTASKSDSRIRSKSLSSVDPKITPSTPITFPPRRVTSPVILGIGGLSARWVAAIVSSDSLFVKNERERYNFARSVVELRRRAGSRDDEESVWASMFEHGIYYTNMTFEDILFISQDISPTNKRPYAPQSMLQASHWTQSVLRHHITQRSNMSTSQPGIVPSPTRDKELGITSTTADILLKISGAEQSDNANAERSKSYFPIFADSSLRIGDNGSNAPGTPLSMEELFNPSQAPAQRLSRLSEQAPPSPTHISTTEDTFFGIFIRRFSGQACVDSDPTAKSRWSSYPPYRFSVEFWDVDLLKEKSRLHSQTIWHAGSLFNVYVQIVRKKGQAQLGIYLHRQSNVDPIPASSAPLSQIQSSRDGMDGILTGSFERQGHHRQPSLPSLLSGTHPAPSNPAHYSPSIHPPSRSTTPSVNPNHARPSSPPSPSSPASSSLTFGTVPSTLSTPAPQQPYRDPRPAVSAYFAISCASATGSSQTRFSSSPDVFSVSQSWGWKSSTLRTEDFVEVGSQPLSNLARSEQVSLRATVLLGLV